MTVSQPANPPPSLSRAALQFAVLLGAEDGSPPSLEDEVDYLEVVEIGRYAGSRPDTITLRYNLAKAEQRLQDITTVPVEHNRMIEIRTVEEQAGNDADTLTQIVGRGRIFGQRQTINQATESVEIAVEFDDALFGGQNLREVPYWDPVEDTGGGTTTKRLNRPLIFNPEIDDIIEGNRAEQTDDDLGYDNLFVDPESLRSITARALQTTGEGKLWTFAQAVQVLCVLLNPDETHLTNPTLEELEGAFDDVDDALLKNQQITFGSSLPAALDQLLNPYRLHWYLATEVDDTDPEAPVTRTKLQFFEAGKGIRLAVYAQRPGEVLEVERTNVSDFASGFSLDLFNRIECATSRIRREGTFELELGWAEADDDLDVYELEENQPLAQEKPNVGRLFVLNEAGDHIGLRDEITAHRDLRELLGETIVARRRKFLPCLSHNEEGRSNGIYVEWLNPDSDEEEEDDQWEQVPWGFSVLEKECGIRFHDATPPDKLMELLQDDPATVRVRVTAVVEGDTRTWGIAERQASSPSGLDLTLTLNLEDRFHDAQVLALDGDSEDEGDVRTSIFWDLFSFEDEANDADAIQDYAEQLREIEDVGEVSASISLAGVDHPEYIIGDLITTVDGRDLTLDARNPAAGNPRPPQIVGIKWKLGEEQTTELLLETFREERP